jgi:transposase
MPSVTRDHDAIHLGLDVHKNTISAGVLEPGADNPVVDRISADEDAVRRLIGRFDDPGRVRACYEAGPTGYELARLLRSLGVHCEVIAPSLIPTAPGDRIQTDKRDARRLVRLYRAGELTAIRVPTVAEEAVRDLCRARADMVIDQTRARHRLGTFLLRHGRVWRGGDNWTHKHQAWIAAQRFDDPACRRRSPTTGPRSRPGRPPSPRSRSTWPDGSPARPSPTRWPGWLPTAGSPTSAG